MWVAMLLVARGEPRASGAGNLLHDMVTRFMGLIVLAMGVQFALTGFHNFSAKDIIQIVRYWMVDLTQSDGPMRTSRNLMLIATLTLTLSVLSDGSQARIRKCSTPTQILNYCKHVS
jgi:predicted ATP-dependent Lon-type protease